MKICFISDLIPGIHKSGGGAELAVEYLLKFHKENGYSVSTISLTPGFGEGKITGENDFFIKNKHQEYSRWINFNLCNYLKVRKILLNLRPGAVFIQNINRLTYSAVFAASSAGIPVLFSVYDYFLFCPYRILSSGGKICRQEGQAWCKDCPSFNVFKLRLRNLFSKAVISRISRFIVLSTNSKELLEGFGIKSSRIAVLKLPLKTDGPVCQETGNKMSADKKKTILFVGWIQRHKGVETILQACRLLLSENYDFRLVIVKTGPGRLEQFFDIREIGQYIEIRERMEHNELNKLMSEAYMLVIPEEWENMGPLILGEALLLGCAVVASNIGGLPEYAENGKSALFFRPGNAEDLKNKIKMLLDDEALRDRMSANAAVLGSKIFNRPELTEKYLALYNEVLGEKTVIC